MIKVTLSGHIQQFDCTFSICALRPGWKMPKISSFNHDILFRFPSFVLHIFLSQSFKKKKILLTFALHLEGNLVTVTNPPIITSKLSQLWCLSATFRLLFSAPIPDVVSSCFQYET